MMLKLPYYDQFEQSFSILDLDIKFLKFQITEKLLLYLHQQHQKARFCRLNTKISQHSKMEVKFRI